MITHSETPTKNLKSTPNLSQEVLNQVFSDDPSERLLGFKFIDTFLNDYIPGGNAVVIESGVVPIALDIIRRNDIGSPELLFHTAVCVSCISAGSQEETLLIQASDIIPFVYEVFSSSYPEAWDSKIKGQIGLIVGNIAGNNPESCQYALSQQAYQNTLKFLRPLTSFVQEMNQFLLNRQKFLHTTKESSQTPLASTEAEENSEKVISTTSIPNPSINKSNSTDITNNPMDSITTNNIKLPPELEIQKDTLSYIRTLLWTMSNIYRWVPRPLFHLQPNDDLFSLLVIFWEINDYEIVRDIAWCLSYITDSNEISMNRILRSPSILQKLQSLLTSHTHSFLKNHYSDILHPILRIYGNFASGLESQTEIVITHQLLPQMSERLIQYPIPKLQQEMGFIVSNVLMGTMSQRIHAIQSGILINLLEILLTTHHDKVRKEATWALAALRLQEEVEEETINSLSATCYLECSNSQRQRMIEFLMKTITGLRLFRKDTIVKNYIAKIISLHLQIPFLFEVKGYNPLD